MNLSEEVDLEDYVSRPDKISNAEIAAICQVGRGRCLKRKSWSWLISGRSVWLLPSAVAWRARIGAAGCSFWQPL